MFGLRRTHSLIDDGNVGHIFFCNSSIFFFSLFHFPFKKNFPLSSQDSPISFTLLQASVFYSLSLFLSASDFFSFLIFFFQVMMLSIQTPKKKTSFQFLVIAASLFPLFPKYVVFLSQNFNFNSFMQLTHPKFKRVICISCNGYKKIVLVFLGFFDKKENNNNNNNNNNSIVLFLFQLYASMHFPSLT